MNEEELYRLYYEAREELAKYPGVVGVGLGLKERGGALTRETAFRVYVKEKKKSSDLPPSARIPASYKGVATDVLKVREAVPRYAHSDQTTHSPLVGGISITNGRRGAQGFAIGTLGFFATIDGVEGPDNIALVTNRHVLARNGGQLNDDVYQPNLLNIMPNNGIGKTHRMPEIDNHHFQYPPPLRLTPGEPAGDFWIDCATAKLNICISSCCHTNCGVSFANEIIGLNVAGGNALVDVARARHGETVFKVGRTTGRTEGTVSDVAAVVSGGGLTANGILEVTFVRATEPDVFMFSDEGDSGSAIVNNDGKLVGLHYSAALTPDKSLNSHIHPVLDALQVTPITTANPVHDNAAAVGMIGNVPVLVDGRPSQALALRDRLLQSPEGPRIAALIEAHRQEVVHLVNHNRRVTVVWHRHQGPAFLNRAIHNARDPEQTIPREIQGITGAMLLASMGNVLAEQGSPALRDAIGQYREEVLALAEGCDNLHELVDRLSERQPA
jgi:hypothetical protein